MNKNILICGVGGQGTVLASKIIAASAMEDGFPVQSAETIGMAQRGGSVVSHVRIGEAFEPLIPFGTADMILAFEPAEAVRNLPYLKRGGVVIVNSVPVKPVTESLQETGYDGREMITYLQTKCSCIVVDAEKLCSSFGSSRYFNIAILGVASGTGRLGMEKDTILSVMEKQVKKDFIEKNRAAFETGYAIGAEFYLK